MRKSDKFIETECNFDTRMIHAGTRPDEATGARSVPIYQTTSFVFDSADHAAKLFGMDESGYIYSRLTNPTVAALEKRVANLEGGVGATCTASGLSAQMLAFYALMGPGDEFVCSNRLYGGSLNQMGYSFGRAFDWGCHFVDITDLDQVKAAITPKTKLIFAESLSNPGGVVADIAALAKIAQDADIPLIIDNTMATPYLCRPLEHGASIVTHSTTKFLSGHGNSMGGLVTDSGTFNWSNGKFPTLSEPEPSYHGRIFHKDFGKMALTFYNHAVGLRDLGPNQQPMNAFLTITGIETLSLRMEKHCANSIKIAEFLEGHPSVDWVSYSGLETSPYFDLAQKYMPRGAGAVFTFGIKGGYEAGKTLVESVNIFSHLANIGDTRSLIIHPASTTHKQLSPDAKISAGASDETIRLSIGIEDVEDLIADLDQALGAATSAVAA